MNSHTGIAIRFLFAHGTRAKAKNDQGPFQSSLHMGLKRNAFKKQHNTWTSWSCSNSLLIDFKMKIKTSNHNLLQTTWFSTTYPFLSQIIFLQIFLYFIPLIKTISKQFLRCLLNSFDVSLKCNCSTAIWLCAQEPRRSWSWTSEEGSKCHSHGQSVKADLHSRVTTWIWSVFSVFSVRKIVILCYFSILQCRISE